MAPKATGRRASLLDLVGKEVILYPNGDEDEDEQTRAIVEEVGPGGALFKITASGDDDYRPGKLRFIAWSCRLTFEEV